MDKQIIVVLALVAACGKSKAECKTGAGELASYLSAMEHEPSYIPDSDLERYQIVTRTDLGRSPVVEAPLVIMSPTEITFQGQLVDLLGGPSESAPLHSGLGGPSESAPLHSGLGGPSESAPLHSGLGGPSESAPLHSEPETLGERLTANHGKLADAHLPAGYVPRVMVLIDGAVEWGKVAKVAELVSTAGFEHLGLVFLRPAVGSPAPSRTADTAVVADVESLSKLASSCRSFGKLFGSLGSVENGDKAQMLIDGLVGALVECNCDVDLTALRSALAKLIGQPHPTSLLDLTLARDATPIEQPAALPWRDAHKQLVQHAKVWLVAR